MNIMVQILGIRLHYDDKGKLCSALPLSATDTHIIGNEELTFLLQKLVLQDQQPIIFRKAVRRWLDKNTGRAWESELADVKRRPNGNYVYCDLIFSC